MLRRRPFALGVVVFALQAAAALAQSNPPWTGIAADEARPFVPYWNEGSSEMMDRAMSADGRFVVFNSDKANLVPGDTNNWSDVFLRDRQTGELRRVSVATDGSQGNHYSAFPTISKNGRHVAFNSCATNFDAIPNGACNLFIHDRELATTVRASIGPSGEQAMYVTQHFFTLSADGRYMVFSASFDGYYVTRKVWLRDRDTDENGIFDEPGGASTTLISQPVEGQFEM